MAIVVLFAASLVLLTLPVLVSFAGFQLMGIASAACVLLGTALALISGIAVVFVRLYRKTKASEAFVRTGSGGVKVIRDGGAIVIPVLHELVSVSLRTLKLEVCREQQDALITFDKLRADIRAEFFVRVQPDQESILQASRSLGEKLSEPSAVKELVEDKLVSALRTAAAGKSLEQLNSERDEFLTEVTKLVGDDLRSNGLILETVTISRLDQTDECYLKEQNIFDAQGRRKIAEITQVNLTERNRLVREGEQARKSQDVEAQQRVLALAQVESEAIARQAAEVAKVEAETSRAAQVEVIEAKRQIELAEVQKAEALQVAAHRQNQAVAVAESAKQEQVARAEMQRTAAEQELAEAEAEREKAQQHVLSVKVNEEAERAKRCEVLEAQAEAEKQFVTRQRQADAEAYAIEREAAARQTSASAQAEAVRKQAAADAEAQRQRAEGEQALAMVPIQIQRAQVEVERERLETVVKPELQAREDHGKVAQDFELKKLHIEAERTVRIATADATASLFTKMEAKLFGTPEDVNKLLRSVLDGQGTAMSLNAFFDATDGKAEETVSRLTAGLEKVATAAATRLTGEKSAAE